MPTLLSLHIRPTTSVVLEKSKRMGDYGSVKGSLKSKNRNSRDESNPEFEILIAALLRERDKNVSLSKILGK